MDFEAFELFPPLAEAWARVTDPPTSHEAAESVRGDRATYLEKLVVKDLKENGPSTTWEISGRTETNWSSIGPRMKPLEKKGLVRKTDKKRLSPNGRNCIVYEAAA